MAGCCMPSRHKGGRDILVPGAVRECVVNVTPQLLYAGERNCTGGWCAYVHKISPQPGLEPWKVQSVSSHYTACTILAAFCYSNHIKQTVK